MIGNHMPEPGFGAQYRDDTSGMYSMARSQPSYNQQHRRRPDDYYHRRSDSDNYFHRGSRGGSVGVTVPNNINIAPGGGNGGTNRRSSGSGVRSQQWQQQQQPQNDEHSQVDHESVLDMLRFG